MTEKIQSYTVPGKGIATEAKFEVQGRFTTQNRAILYYDLRDPNGTTTAYDKRINQYVTLPYAILFRSKIVLTGDDRAAVLADSTFASNIIFRDRTDIVKDEGPIKSSTLLIAAISYSDAKEACLFFAKGKTQTFYIDNEDFSKATLIAEDEEMKTPIKEIIYISDGSLVRYWKGKSFDEEFLDTCNLKQ
jgi:hypothetical protein